MLIYADLVFKIECYLDDFSLSPKNFISMLELRLTTLDRITQIKHSPKKSNFTAPFYCKCMFLKNFITSFTEISN